jgi:Fe2+ or Zn2+ uptake regulation protein
MENKKFRKELKKDKKRITRGRGKVIDIFSSTRIPITADYLTRKVGMNKTSIYREITFLLKEGFIQEINFADRKKRYELKEGKHHHHLICLKCKKISDVVLTKDLRDEESKIEKLNHFKVTKHNLEFFGYCQGCQ